MILFINKTPTTQRHLFFIFFSVMAPTPLLYTLFAAAITSLALANVISMTSASPSHPRDFTPRSSSKDKSRSSTVENSAPLAEADMPRVADCPSRQFFSDVDLACKPCSACPVNQIIRRPCSARADTWCGPFLEFDKFHQTPVEKTAGGARTEAEERREGGKHHTGEDCPRAFRFSVCFFFISFAATAPPPPPPPLRYRFILVLFVCSFLSSFSF